MDQAINELQQKNARLEEQVATLTAERNHFDNQRDEAYRKLSDRRWWRLNAYFLAAGAIFMCCVMGWAEAREKDQLLETRAHLQEIALNWRCSDARLYTLQTRLAGLRPIARIGLQEPDGTYIKFVRHIELTEVLIESTETLPDECVHLKAGPINTVDIDAEVDPQMGWASFYIGQLMGGKSVTFRPRGNSMAPKIKSGQLVTVSPATVESVAVGDVVLARVQGHEFIHFVDAKTATQVRIANASGRVNGWTKLVYGKVTRIED